MWFIIVLLTSVVCSPVFLEPGKSTCVLTNTTCVTDLQANLIYTNDSVEIFVSRNASLHTTLYKLCCETCRDLVIVPFVESYVVKKNILFIRGNGFSNVTSGVIVGGHRVELTVLNTSWAKIWQPVCGSNMNIIVFVTHAGHEARSSKILYYWCKFPSAPIIIFAVFVCVFILIVAIIVLKPKRQYKLLQMTSF